MNARIKIPLNSASRATRVRNSSGLTSRNSPGAVTRPRASEPRPEIIVISPVKLPAWWVTIKRSPCRVGCTISRLPESSTKNGAVASPGSNKISPAFHLPELAERADAVDLRRCKRRKGLLLIDGPSGERGTSAAGTGTNRAEDDWRGHVSPKDAEYTRSRLLGNPQVSWMTRIRSRFQATPDG